MHRRKLYVKKLMKNANITAVTCQAASFRLSCIWFITKYVKRKKAKKLPKNDTEPAAPRIY